MTFMILAGKMNRKELAMNTIDLIGAGIESVSNITIERKAENHSRLTHKTVIYPG